MNQALKIAGLAGLLLLSSKAVSAESKFVKFLKSLEYNVGIGIEQMAKNPAEDYIAGVNNDFRNGKYTFTNPISDWKNIPISNSNATGLEASILYDTDKIVKGTKAGIIIGTGQSNITSNYDENYNIYDEYSGLTIPDNFKRAENININSISIGAKVKAKLKKWLSGFLTLKQENYKVEGNVDYTMDRLDNEYVQWRKADYSGTGMANSLEIGFDFDITKNVSIGFGVGSRNCGVKTSGKSIRTQTSNNEVTIYNYSPEFKLNSSYAFGDIKLKFQ